MIEPKGKISLDCGDSITNFNEEKLLNLIRVLTLLISKDLPGHLI